MRNVSKNSLIEAMEASVFLRVVHSVSDQKRVQRTCSVSYKLMFTEIQKYKKWRNLTT
jgi:hypothetical protein